MDVFTLVPKIESNANTNLAKIIWMTRIFPDTNIAPFAPVFR